eukprot:752393-Rhodomonas_salina.4
MWGPIVLWLSFRPARARSWPACLLLKRSYFPFPLANVRASAAALLSQMPRPLKRHRNHQQHPE